MKIRLSTKQRLDRESNMIRILRILRSGSRGFNQIKIETGFSTRTVSNHLSRLEKDGLIVSKISGKRVLYSVTSKGIRHGGVWLLINDLLDMKDSGSSYIGGQESTELPGIVVHNVMLPRNLSEYVNTVKIEENTKLSFAKELIRELIKGDLDRLPKDSRSLIGFEVRINEFVSLARAIKRFVSDVKSGVDIISDAELGFGVYRGNKLELLESYLEYVDFVEDEDYVNSLGKLLKSEGFVGKIVHLGEYGQFTDVKTLTKVATCLCTSDPLDDVKLVKRLIVRAPRGGFYEPIYDYVAVVRILNHNDKTFVNVLKRYEYVNRFDLAKSKVNEIEAKLRSKRRNS